MGGLGSSLGERIVGMRGESLSRRTRAKRYEMLLRRFPDLADMRVLDLGGSPHSWQGAPVRPREVVLLNVDWVAGLQSEEIGADAAWMTMVAGDACEPPPEILDERFDLVFSNSVIEHVGGHHQRLRLAHHARMLGEHYWIQTPNRGFPIEPHQIFPAFQFLPLTWRAGVVRRWPLTGSHMRSWTTEEAMRYTLNIELLSPAHMRFYFPDAEIVRERVAGLTKSLIAVR